MQAYVASTEDRPLLPCLACPRGSKIDSLFARRIREDSLGRTAASWQIHGDTFMVYRYDSRNNLNSVTRYQALTASACAPDSNYGFECVTADSVPLKAWFYGTINAIGNAGTYINDSTFVTPNGDFEPASMDTLLYDRDGNLVRRRTLNYRQDFFWNAISQLDSVITRVNGVVQSRARYRYDGWGRRNWKQVGNDSIRYIWDGDNVFLEYNAALAPGPVYVYAPGSLSPVGMAWALHMHYFLYDEANNVAGVIRDDGLLEDVWRWGPWGTREGTRTTYNPYGFSGQYTDFESGLVYMRNRYYDPRSRRFISEDPIGLAGGINLYMYAGNDPVNSSDPMGLQSEACHRVKVSYWQGPSDAPFLVEYYVWDCPNPDPSGLNRVPRSSRGGNATTNTAGVFGGGGLLSGPGVSGNQQASLGSRVASCAAEEFGLTPLIGAGLVGAGLPILNYPRAGVGGAQAIGKTSVASHVWRSIVNVELSKPTAAPVWGNLSATSRSLGTVLGRWTPILGWGILAIDVLNVGYCAYLGGD